MALKDLIRDAPVGQILRWLTNDRILLYPEEEPEFVLPKEWTDLNAVKIQSNSSITSLGTNDLKLNNAGKVPSSDEAIVKDASTPILVDWYSADDKTNPLNWSNGKKTTTTAVICLYTFVVYLASSIYVSSESGVRLAFGVSQQQASFPLSLFVLAYGLGPMLFAPLSEMASVGRNRVYAWTFFIFILVSIPITLVENFTAFVTLRFFQGFFGSPCLANGGASIQDIYSEFSVPFGLSIWVAATSIGPSIGPLLSGYAVDSGNPGAWRWSVKEILWLAAPIGLCLGIFLAETSSSAILTRRAARIRKVMKCDRFKSYSEIHQEGLTPQTILLRGLIKPAEIAFQDPAVAFTTVYTSLIYGIYYTFFEVFPLVFGCRTQGASSVSDASGGMYQFDLGQTGLVFMCIIIASTTGAIIYAGYVYFCLNPLLRKEGPKPQEYRLRPALLGCFLPPIGLFVFGWTADPEIPWIVCLIGLGTYSVGVFITLQCISIYIPRSYPRYSASLFASNELFRSVVATGAIHFATPLYTNLSVATGVSILAGLSTLGIAGMYFLYFCGGRMREKSKFATSVTHLVPNQTAV